MSDSFDKENDPRRDEHTTARLLQLAGSRPQIPQDMEQRVYQRVRDEWQAASTSPEGQRVYRHVRSEWKKGSPGRHTRRWLLPVALAASALVAVAIVLQPAPAPPGPTLVAPVVHAVDAAGNGNLPVPGHQVHAGDRLSTGSGEALSLSLARLESVRLDEQSTLIAKSDHQFELVEGRMYIDSGDLIYRSKGLEIETPSGKVTDIGTQFVVRADGETLEIAVREGRVDVRQDVRTVVAVAGDRVQFDGSADPEFSTIASHDDYWSWATDLAPTFAIENRSLLDFLRWVARETGRELVFESEDLRIAAMRTVLHGDVAGHKPLDAVDSVMLTTKFRYRIEPTKIVIES